MKDTDLDVENMIKGLLSGTQLTMRIGNENDLLQNIANDENIPKIREEHEDILPSFTNYSQNAIKFGRRVQLLINHRNNTLNLFSCSFPLRSTILYYFAKHPREFVLFWYKYRNRPIKIAPEELSMLYGEEDLPTEE